MSYSSVSNSPKSIETWAIGIDDIIASGFAGIMIGIVSLLLAGGISWLIGWVVRLLIPKMLGLTM